MGHGGPTTIQWQREERVPGPHDQQTDMHAKEGHSYLVQVLREELSQELGCILTYFGRLDNYSISCSDGSYQGLDGEDKGVVPSSDNQYDPQGLWLDVGLVQHGEQVPLSWFSSSPFRKLLQHEINFSKHRNDFLTVCVEFALSQEDTVNFHGSDILRQGNQSPGGPVVRTLLFHCRGHGFDPWPRN